MPTRRGPGGTLGRLGLRDVRAGRCLSQALTRQRDVDLLALGDDAHGDVDTGLVPDPVRRLLRLLESPEGEVGVGDRLLRGGAHCLGDRLVPAVEGTRVRRVEVHATHDPTLVHDGKGQAAGHAHLSAGAGVQLPTVLVEQARAGDVDGVGRVHRLQARPSVDVLHRVEPGDGLRARDQGERHLVLDHAEAQPHQLRHQRADAGGHGEQLDPEVRLATDRQLTQGFHRLREWLHAPDPTRRSPSFDRPRRG